MRNSSFNIEYLSPTGFIGFWELFIGLFFRGVMFYFVFFRLNEDFDSYKDIERRKLEEDASDALGVALCHGVTSTDTPDDIKPI